MEPKEIAAWATRALPGAVCKESWGEAAWFYNPGSFFANGAYFMTIKRSDGPNDAASRLEREGVWRLSFGLPYDRYETLFGGRPARPGKGGVIDGDWPFDAIDRLTPHPVYGWMGWAAINCPERRSFETLKPFLKEAHRKARLTFEARARRAA